MDSEGWSDACRWPRRLLHIASMTSYPWMPSNRYGDYYSPAYTALSYTWGRWKLSDGVQPDVRAIPVKGVAWDIPRIDPIHFTAEQFHDAIRDTAIPHPSESVRDDVDFLWLDVACIDQRDDSPEMAREIGRQAKIFRGASRVYIWLTTYKYDFVHAWALDMDKNFQMMVSAGFEKRTDLGEWIANMCRLVQEIITDPWFTSLWTLQESFLSPNANILIGDARKASLDLWSLKALSDLLI